MQVSPPDLFSFFSVNSAYNEFLHISFLALFVYTFFYPARNCRNLSTCCRLVSLWNCRHTISGSTLKSFGITSSWLLTKESSLVTRSNMRAFVTTNSSGRRFTSRSSSALASKSKSIVPLVQFLYNSGFILLEKMLCHQSYDFTTSTLHHRKSLAIRNCSFHF